MRYLRIMLSILLFPVVAFSMENNDRDSPKSSYVITLSGGISWENAGYNQTLNFTSDIVKAYRANQATHSLSEEELFLGIQRALPYALAGQIGLAYGITGHATLSGDIWDDGFQSFDNYTYHYYVQHQYIALKGKLFTEALSQWFLQPWISLTVGVGFNKSYQYSNTPTIEEAVAMPNFSNHIQTTFTYAVGVGVQRELTQHWQLGLGYEFSDWGNSALGAAADDSTGQHLALSHLYTNSILLNLTYLT